METLVSIAIIGSIAALLMAVVPRAILSGKQAATAGNMRQIGVAVGLYVADHDGQLPGGSVVAVFPAGKETPAAGDSPSLGNYLAPYLGSAGTGTQYVGLKALECPALSAHSRNFNNWVANYVFAEMANNICADPEFDYRFGDWQGTWGQARSASRQPKKISAAQTGRAFLVTADKLNWSSVNNFSLPDKGVFGGRRLWLFLDGSSILSDTAYYPPTR